MPMTLDSRKQKSEVRQFTSISGLRSPVSGLRGYTLVELIVAVGLFALIMMLASGAYFIMINLNRQIQGATTGINNLSFALETMTRDIRTGTNYSNNSGTSFTFTPSDGGTNVTYALGTQQAPNGPVGDITKNGSALTDTSVNISSLMFYVSGTSRSDALQPRVTIIVSGEVSYGAGKTESFSVETGATMRGSDI
ncbi:prepilin-type N-terminal cleavage/methylation domain-containing protein [Candidatus Kaiserbacteria bacterium]|nr:prepilin-type N-terminal cleavage/methylation domain-containing protein [Candidatus Kaiserbacteria bacterium]